MEVEEPENLKLKRRQHPVDGGVRRRATGAGIKAREASTALRRAVKLTASTHQPEQA
jgi:hypothetical protein